ncbi:MAG TPA: single-stranded DNA-binding protein [Thermoleophilaceae bacterium]
MNVVSLIGRVTGEPQLRTSRAGVAECRMRLAVPRYSGRGIREPGVVYVEASTFGLRAQECAERLREGSNVGLSGRLEDDPPDEARGVYIHQLDFLDPAES